MQPKKRKFDTNANIMWRAFKTKSFKKNLYLNIVLLRKGQRSGSDTILEILNAIVLYFSNERIYMNVFIYEAYECSTSKSVVQECMLYK